MQFFFWLFALSIMKNKASWTNTRHILVFSYPPLNVKKHSLAENSMFYE